MAAGWESGPVGRLEYSWLSPPPSWEVRGACAGCACSVGRSVVLFHWVRMDLCAKMSQVWVSAKSLPMSV